MKNSPQKRVNKFIYKHEHLNVHTRLDTRAWIKAWLCKHLGAYKHALQYMWVRTKIFWCTEFQNGNHLLNSFNWTKNLTESYYELHSPASLCHLSHEPMRFYWHHCLHQKTARHWHLDPHSGKAYEVWEIWEWDLQNKKKINLQSTRWK